jgi:hypothetical protein
MIDIDEYRTPATAPASDTVPGAICRFCVEIVAGSSGGDILSVDIGIASREDGIRCVLYTLADAVVAFWHLTRAGLANDRAPTSRHRAWFADSEPPALA